jgi:hypothetical protein
MTSMPHSALLNSDQKQLVRECVFLYVKDVQSRFYADKTITAAKYEEEMQRISEIVEILHLKNVYT